MPYGLSRRDDDGEARWRVFLRVPLFPWFHARRYRIETDQFGRGWFMHNVLLSLDRYGPSAFGMRIAFGAMAMGPTT